MSNYYNALETCDQAIFDLLGAINDHLPDGDGIYLFDYTWGDCEYIYSEIHKTTDIILSTIMRYHVTHELLNAVNTYDIAFSKKDINGCKVALMKCYHAFREIRIVCQRAKKEISVKGEL